MFKTRRFAVAAAAAVTALIGGLGATPAAAAASIAPLLGFRLAAKPADAEHPFGHGRVEYVAGFCIAGLILLIGFKLLEASVEKILAPEPPEVSVSMLVILTASIALQLWLGRFNKTIGERIDSAAIRAADTLIIGGTSPLVHPPAGKPYQEENIAADVYRNAGYFYGTEG